MRRQFTIWPFCYKQCGDVACVLLFNRYFIYRKVGHRHAIFRFAFYT